MLTYCMLTINVLHSHTEFSMLLFIIFCLLPQLAFQNEMLVLLRLCKVNPTFFDWLILLSDL